MVWRDWPSEELFALHTCDMLGGAISRHPNRNNSVLNSFFSFSISSKSYFVATPSDNQWVIIMLVMKHAYSFVLPLAFSRDIHSFLIFTILPTLGKERSRSADGRASVTLPSSF